MKDLFLTATVNLDESGDPIVEESSADNNAKSESFQFFQRKTLFIGYLEACRVPDFDLCEPDIHNADPFLRKVFPAAETSGVLYFPLAVPNGLFIARDKKPGKETVIAAAIFLLENLADAVVIWVADLPFRSPSGARNTNSFGGLREAREKILAYTRNFGIVPVEATTGQRVQVALAVSMARNFGAFTPECQSVGRGEFPTAIGLEVQGRPVLKIGAKDLGRCKPPEKVWVSAETYGKLFLTNFTAPFSAPGSLQEKAAPRRTGRKAQSGPTETFLVSGTVRGDGGGSLDPAFLFRSLTPLGPGAATGRFCVELSSPGGSLGRTCFDADFDGVSERPFVVALPHQAGATRIALLDGGAELASLDGGANSPILAITSPAAGDTLDSSTPLTVGWTASDTDGDSVIFTALYSPDGGASWLPLGVDIVESSFTFNAAEIQGGENVLFRVLASDGFHTSEQTIGPVNVVQRLAIEADAPADLGAAPAGQLSEGVVPLRSVGTGPLVVEAATSDNPAFRVLSRMPMQVRAGTTRNLEVEFTPGMIGKETGTLTLTTNAPDQPTFDVLVEATGLDPEQAIFFVSIESDTLDFGETLIGQAADVPIAIINRGQAGMSVEATLEGDGFRFEQTTAALTDERPGQAALTVSGGQQLNLTVIFEPPSQQEFNGRLALASDDQNQSRVEIALEGSGVEPPSTPAISGGGIVDAAQFQALVARGAIGSIFGSELADDIVSAGDVPLPFELGGARVLVDSWEAPLFFVSPNQINFQVPFEVTSPGQVNVVVTRNGEDSPIEPATMAEFAPAVFINPATGEPIVQRFPDGALITATNPANPGDVLILFLTGLGGVSNAPPTGAAAAASPLAQARVTPVVTVGGEGTQVFFAGLAPFFVGLGQINIQLPERLVTTGLTMPLVVDFEGIRNPPVNLPVRFNR